MHEEPQGIRVVVYDHTFQGNRAWFRFAFKWTDTKTGEARSRAGMQSHRIEDGKLVETWLSMQPLGSAWTDTRKSVGQARPIFILLQGRLVQRFSRSANTASVSLASMPPSSATWRNVDAAATTSDAEMVI